MPVRKLEAVDPRVETGPVQFGDNKPGIFLESSTALAMAADLEDAVHCIAKHDERPTLLIANLFHYRAMLYGLYQTDMDFSEEASDASDSARE